jgi:S-adenosylmethionine:tRNA ribosyltransferase-isomerase
VLDFPGYFNEEIQNGDVVCRCLIKSSKRTKSGTQFIVNDNLKGQILDGKEGVYSVKFNVKGNFDEILYKCGEIPLPPYIRRKEGKPTPDDVLFYQTVYASRKGAVAAPTAGLHFTKRLIERLKSKGVLLVEITLHVGYGTFLPVRVSDIREHRMHSEWYEISEASAEQVNSCKRSGSRVIAVGTTCVRALEFASDEQGMVKSGKRECNLFIYPGYRFKVINGMITNFHLPKSTLLMLVSSFAGKERLFSAYQEAIRKKYRFFSYGDAMLIL